MSAAPNITEADAVELLRLILKNADLLEVRDAPPHLLLPLDANALDALATITAAADETEDDTEDRAVDDDRLDEDCDDEPDVDDEPSEDDEPDQPRAANYGALADMLRARRTEQHAAMGEFITTDPTGVRRRWIAVR